MSGVVNLGDLGGQFDDLGGGGGGGALWWALCVTLGGTFCDLGGQVVTLGGLFV